MMATKGLTKAQKTVLLRLANGETLYWRSLGRAGYSYWFHNPEKGKLVSVRTFGALSSKGLIETIGGDFAGTCVLTDAGRRAVEKG